MVRLTTLYDRLLQSPRLAGVAQVWGEPGDAGPIATPRIVWVPTEDDFGPGESEMTETTVGGQLAYLEQRAERQAGGELRLYAQGQPLAAARALELLIDQVVLALDDQHDLAQALQLRAGRWMTGPECPPGTTGYRISLRLRAPIYHQHPAAAAQSADYQYEVR